MMKKITFLLLGLVVILGALIWYFKPSDSTSTTTNNIRTENQTLTDVHETKPQSKEHLIQAQPSSEPIHIQNENSELSLADTKSDFSIQPIDPETDPGNQIVESN